MRIGEECCQRFFLSQVMIGAGIFLRVGAFFGTLRIYKFFLEIVDRGDVKTEGHVMRRDSSGKILTI